MLPFTSNAALKIDINQGNIEPLPIAISDFYNADGSRNSIGSQIKEVVEKDLKDSGLFKRA